MKLRYCTSSAVEELRHTIRDHLDWYYAPRKSHPVTLINGFRESKIKSPELADKLTINEKSPSESDASNALVVHRALQSLTPHQASIERMWVYLCHFDYPQYVSKRWLSRRPDSEKDAVRQVDNHFFAQGNRALIRDNGLSRLWWLGNIAHKIEPDNPQEFLDILLYRQDVRSALIERPSVSMNKRLLRGIYTVMKKHWENEKVLFEREAFRSWMIALNRRGGVILLDALPDDVLKQLLHDEADRAVTIFASK